MGGKAGYQNPTVISGTFSDRPGTAFAGGVGGSGTRGGESVA